MPHEFRVFFPARSGLQATSSTSSTSVTSSSITSSASASDSTSYSSSSQLSTPTLYYNELVQSLLSKLNIKNKTEWETRSDRYLVSPSHIGIKIRGERGLSPLEMKVRKKISSPCLEKWKKHRMAVVDSGCTSIESHASGIIEQLQSDKVFEGNEEEFIRRGLFIDVLKSRTSISGGVGSSFSLAEEFCTLKVRNSATGNEDLWYSICIEGPKDDIQICLKRKAYVKDILVILSTAMVECSADEWPVIGGYPSWIESIGLKDLHAMNERLRSNFELLQTHVNEGI